MPITVPRKVAPIAEAQKPLPPAAAALTVADVVAMMDARDAMWREQISALESAFASAMSALPKPAPRTGSDIKFKYDERGIVTGAEIIPKE